MPSHIENYTDLSRISQWLNGRPGVYPAEARGVLVDYTINHPPRQILIYWLRNYGQMLAEAITPSISLMWPGEASAQDSRGSSSQGLLQGRLFEEVSSACINRPW